jgi:hypothetical protein
MFVIRSQDLIQQQLEGSKAMGKNQYVVRNGNGWGVRGEGNERLTGSFETQAAAISRGREIAQNQGAELRIQGKNGQFREGWSYGNDPYPPKG